MDKEENDETNERPFRVYLYTFNLTPTYDKTQSFINS